MTRQLKCDIILSSSIEEIQKNVPFSYGTLTLCYKGNDITQEDIKALEKEKSALISSIERRKKLLSNTGYVNNAPEKIVNLEREKLSDEESKLKILLDKLN